MVVELGNVLNDRAYLITSLTCLHNEGKGADISSHVLTVLVGLNGFVLEVVDGLAGQDALILLHSEVILYNIAHLIGTILATLTITLI